MPLEIVPPGTQIDFIGKRRIAFGLSAALLLATVVAIQFQGIRLGIDFAGGTEVQLRFPADSAAEEGVIRTIATACGVSDPAGT